jgi:hypothetical protein
MGKRKESEWVPPLSLALTHCTPAINIKETARGNNFASLNCLFLSSFWRVLLPHCVWAFSHSSHTHTVPADLLATGGCALSLFGVEKSIWHPSFLETRRLKCCARYKKKYGLLVRVKNKSNLSPAQEAERKSISRDPGPC